MMMTQLAFQIKKHQMGAWFTREIHGQTVEGHGTAKRQEVLAPGQLEPDTGAALAMGRRLGRGPGPGAT